MVFTVAFTTALAGGGNYIGPTAGSIFYTTSTMETINERLGNSPVLQQQYEFGRSYAYGLQYFKSNKTDRIRQGVVLQRINENASGSAPPGSALSLKSSLLNDFVLYNIDFRLYPINERKFGDYTLKRQIQSIYILGGLQAGLIRQTHSYAFNWEENNTRISYDYRTLLAAAGTSFEVGWRLRGSIDLALYIGYLYGQSINVTAHVADYVIQGEEVPSSVANKDVTQLAKGVSRYLQIALRMSFRFGHSDPKR